MHNFTNISELPFWFNGSAAVNEGWHSFGPGLYICISTDFIPDPIHLLLNAYISSQGCVCKSRGHQQIFLKLTNEKTWFKNVRLIVSSLTFIWSPDGKRNICLTVYNFLSLPTCLPSALTRLKFYPPIAMEKLGGNDQIPHSTPFIKTTILFTKIFTHNSILVLCMCYDSYGVEGVELKFICNKLYFKVIIYPKRMEINLFQSTF